MLENERGLIGHYSEEDMYVFNHPLMKSLYSPITSRLATYDIIDYVTKNKLDIIIHDCSNESSLLTSLKVEENQTLKALKTLGM